MIILHPSSFGGEMPAQAIGAQCPTVKITCPSAWTTSSPVIVSAEVSNAAPGAALTYNWAASAGTIKSGQGTHTITIDVSSLAGQSVTATVEIGGIQGCPLTDSCSLPTHSMDSYQAVDPRVFDQYSGLTFREEKERLDNLASQLLVEPDTKAYIVLYAGRRSRAGEVQARIRRARKYLITHGGIDAERIVFADGGTREDLTFELYIMPRNLSITLYPIIAPDGPTPKSKTRDKKPHRSHQSERR
jgi:hypothetical protein